MTSAGIFNLMKTTRLQIAGEDTEEVPRVVATTAGSIYAAGLVSIELAVSAVYRCFMISGGVW